MKKILYITLILLITINLFGCQAKDNTSKDLYNFEYVFKEEYSDKIRIDLAADFISFTKGIVNFHDVAFEDFNLSIEDELSTFMTDIVQKHTEIIDDMNKEEKELFQVMILQAKNVSLLGMLKSEHGIDQESEKMGIKPKYTDEHYEKEFNQLKINTEESIEKAKKFID